MFAKAERIGCALLGSFLQVAKRIKDEFFSDLQSQDDSPTYIIENTKSADENVLVYFFSEE